MTPRASGEPTEIDFAAYPIVMLIANNGVAYLTFSAAFKKGMVKRRV
jgi:hypothetical protein